MRGVRRLPRLKWAKDRIGKYCDDVHWQLATISADMTSPLGIEQALNSLLNSLKTAAKMHNYMPTRKPSVSPAVVRLRRDCKVAFYDWNKKEDHLEVNSPQKGCGLLNALFADKFVERKRKYQPINKKN